MGAWQIAWSFDCFRPCIEDNTYESSRWGFSSLIEKATKIMLRKIQHEKGRFCAR